MNSEPPLTRNERLKRLTKRQQASVSGLRCGASIIVDDGFLQRSERDVLDAKLRGCTGRGHGLREAGHESGLLRERSEPGVLELPCTDVGRDMGTQPPSAEIDLDGINFLVDRHEGLGMHVEINLKVGADRTIAMLVAQLGSDFDETGIEGFATLGIGHFEANPIGRVGARSERVGLAFTSSGR